MDEDKIDEMYLAESREYTFPAYRYWKDGEVLGDNLDVFLDVTYGDPEVVGVVPEDDHWVANVIKDGVEQEKKFLVVDYEVQADGVLPYSEYPNLEQGNTEVLISEPEDLVLPTIPTENETTMPEDTTEIPDIDDSGDVQVEGGEDGEEVDLGSEIESEGSIEDIPEGEPDPEEPTP